MENLILARQKHGLFLCIDGQMQVITRDNPYHSEIAAAFSILEPRIQQAFQRQREDRVLDQNCECACG